jgi:hypothetical protein
MMTLKSNDGTQIAGESGSEDVNEQPSSKVSTTSVARREFLKTSVLASGGILVASRLLTDGGVGGLEKVSAAAQSNPTEKRIGTVASKWGQLWLTSRPAHFASRRAARKNRSTGKPRMILMRPISDEFLIATSLPNSLSARQEIFKRCGKSVKAPVLFRSKMIVLEDNAFKTTSEGNAK